jgi:serine/threonine protein kinase
MKGAKGSAGSGSSFEKPEMKKIGKYRILGVLGKGGMGIVYKARDPDIDRDVAIKTIRFDTLTDGEEKDQMMLRFVREARAAGKLSHPNIITIYDVGREKDITYIVMQCIDGQSLQALIDSGRTFSPQEIVDLLKPICDSLDYAHQNGIVHRDIKPGNIIIDESGKPYLADFGVARVETSTLTQSGTTVGTLSYMSPEQVMGKEVDSRSDIFALGIILYELLAGKKPFSGDNLSTIVYKIVNEDPPRLTEMNIDLPKGYETAIQRALAKNAQDRYQNCGEMIADLENPAHLAEQTLAYEMTKNKNVTVEANRKPWLFLALGILGLVILAGGSYMLFFQKPSLSSGLSSKAEPDQNDAISSVTRSAGPAATILSPEDPDIVKLKEAFENKNYENAIKLAEQVLSGAPDSAVARDYLDRAKGELLAAEIAPILQSGIAAYNKGSFSRCLREMEKVLELDKNNKEAQKYSFLADTSMARPAILALIESHRVAEENEDLLAVLSHVGSPALAEQLQSEYRLLFNGYDGIKSIISDIRVNFSSRTKATASFSGLLTADYLKDGKKKIIFEGVKNWELTRQGKTWAITRIW